MKIKDGFVLREVAGSYIVVAVGEAVKDFHGIINLNDTGAFLWKLLEKDESKEQLVKKLLEEYDVDESTATKDVGLFIKQLSEAKLVK